MVCLGEQSGRFAAVVKGSRGSSKSRLAGLLEPPVELEGQLRRGSNLDGLSQLQLCRGFASLRRRLDALLTAGFLARLFLGSLPEHAPIEAVYPLLVGLLERLGEGSEVATTALLAQDKLLSELGIEPALEGCLGCDSPEVRGFSASAGGMLCAACYAGDGFAVDRQVLAALRELRAASAEGLWPVLDPSVVREVGRIYKRQFQHHLGVPDRVFRAVLPGTPQR